MKPLLEVEELSKSYPIQAGFFRRQIGSHVALSDVSFTVVEGQVVGVIGESGAGKSTLAKCIMCLEPPTSGRIFFAGTEVSTLTYEELAPLRKGFQIVFQNPAESLNRAQTILRAISEVLLFHDIVSGGKELEEYCEELMQKVGLDGSLLSRYPHELSIGQLSRVSLARALSTKPRLLVLDECISSLDISLQAQVLNLLLKLCTESRISYLFISHDLAVVQHLADHVLVMRQGQVVEQGPTEKIFHAPSHPYTKLLLSSRL